MLVRGNVHEHLHNICHRPQNTATKHTKLFDAQVDGFQREIFPTICTIFFVEETGLCSGLDTTKD